MLESIVHLRGAERIERNVQVQLFNKRVMSTAPNAAFDGSGM